MVKFKTNKACDLNNFNQSAIAVDMTMAEVKTTHKPYKTLVEGAIVSLKEIESQIIDPLTKC